MRAAVGGVAYSPEGVSDGDCLAFLGEGGDGLGRGGVEEGEGCWVGDWHEGLDEGGMIERERMESEMRMGIQMGLRRTIAIAIASAE